MMMKQLLVFILISTLLVSCKKEVSETVAESSKTEIKQAVDSILTGWHQAAAKADFEGYFKAMTSDAIFIGTDATEHWDVSAFKEFSKPYFDRGQAWDFNALERHIFVSEDLQTVWFDELLDTWMKLCRGSGVLKKENGQWKIAHYVLSVTVPNDDINDFINLKKDTDSLLTNNLKLNNSK